MDCATPAMCRDTKVVDGSISERSTRVLFFRSPGRAGFHAGPLHFWGAGGTAPSPTGHQAERATVWGQPPPSKAPTGAKEHRQGNQAETSGAPEANLEPPFGAPTFLSARGTNRATPTEMSALPAPGGGGKPATGGCSSRWRRRFGNEGLGDGGEELLGLGFVCGGVAFVVLVVAQGGLGVGLRAVQEVALTGRGGL